MSNKDISGQRIARHKSPTWEENFPKGYGHTSIAYLKRCFGYNNAKNGDLSAAELVVSRCVKQSRIKVLRERYPNAILLPVLGQNKLPLAFTMAIGLPIWCAVYIEKSISRKFLSAIQRLLHKPVFAGYIMAGSAYILVDDVISQGGTIAALREFVIIHGGSVVAVAALAYNIGSHVIAPIKRHLVYLAVKFGSRLVCLLRRLRVAASFEALTNSQAKYLLRLASVGNIEKKLAECVLNQPGLI